MFIKKTSGIEKLPLEVFIEIAKLLSLADLLKICLWSREFKQIVFSSPVTLLSPALQVKLDPFKLLSDLPGLMKLTGDPFKQLFYALGKFPRLLSQPLETANFVMKVSPYSFFRR
jgi:hypothetical protein